MYSQNLKVHVMRSSSFEEFLSEQIDHDQHPEDALRGQVFNYQFLDKSFTKIGFSVYWVKYSRSNLLKDLISFLKKRYCSAFDWESFRSLPPPQGASPRRSLNFGVASVARQVNKLCKAGFISVDVRQELLLSLLDASNELGTENIKKNAPRCGHVELIDGIDNEINQQFWEKTFFY